MVKEFSTIPIMKSLMMESGKTINFGAEELSTMKKYLLSTIQSIIEIGTTQTNSGSNTKVNFPKTAKMARANSTYQMVRSSKAVSRMTWSAEKALFCEEMAVG